MCRSHFAGTFDTSSLASMNKASSSALLTVCTSVFLRISLKTLPVGAQFPLLAHAGHVIARIADGAQRAAVLYREWLV
jgi:hypothetical protein